MLILVLKGAMYELLASSELPETQKEELTSLLAIIRLYKRADEHMEVLADKIEPLIIAGYTFIRGQKRGASASAVGGNSQTLKLHRPRQLPELTGAMKLLPASSLTRNTRNTQQGNRVHLRRMENVRGLGLVTTQPHEGRKKTTQEGA